jgi:hypothetical protein
LCVAGGFLCGFALADGPADPVRDACPGFFDSLARMRGAPSLLPMATFPAPTDPSLRDALLRMVRDDQSVRNDWRTSLTPEQIESLQARMFRVDDDNLSQLQIITTLNGFPDERQVGTDGVSAAWLLVQHADADPELQARMLDQLEASGTSAAVPAESIAMLTDRVLLAQGKMQRYGSQSVFKDGEWTLRPTENREQLDERRAHMGMPPLADYLCAMHVFYGDPSGRDGGEKQ